MLLQVFARVETGLVQECDNNGTCAICVYGMNGMWKWMFTVTYNSLMSLIRENPTATYKLRFTILNKRPRIYEKFLRVGHFCTCLYPFGCTTSAALWKMWQLPWWHTTRKAQTSYEIANLLGFLTCEMTGKNDCEKQLKCDNNFSLQRAPRKAYKY